MFAKYLLFIMTFFTGFSTASENDPFAAKSFEWPLREVAVIASSEGFYPRTISAFKGEKIRFYLTNTSHEDSCFMINSKEVFLPVKRGELTVVEVEFSREERVEFHCPAGNLKGSVTVLEHPKERALRLQKREVASDSRERIWMPREE